MIFSIAAHDPDSGAFGLSITTSGLCVGCRCSYARAGVGAVLTQHHTDPRLGPLGLELLGRVLQPDTIPNDPALVRLHEKVTGTRS